MSNMIEIQYTDSNVIRLTITPNRVTLKFPKESDEATVNKFTDYTNKIVSEFKPIHAFRGKFRKHFNSDAFEISLKSNNYSRYFKF